MRPKKFILIVLALVIAGFRLTSYLWPTKTVPDSGKATPPAPIKAGKSKPTTAPVSLPTQTTMAVGTTPAKPEPKAAGPQTELKTALPDIARMLRDNDLMAIARAYVPPDQLTLELLQQVQKINDSTQEEIADWRASRPSSPRLDELTHPFNGQADMLEAMAEQTPTLNATGDEATYAVPEGMPSSIHPLVMVKINGKWYMKELQFAQGL